MIEIRNQTIHFLGMASEIRNQTSSILEWIGFYLLLLEYANVVWM